MIAGYLRIVAPLVIFSIINNMAASKVTGVELGFVEEIDDKSQLLSHFFPSKVGGKPSWLCLKPVPSLNTIKCFKCEKPCIFLIQVYAPFNENDQCFHRTIFLFICSDPKCCTANNNKNVIALRSQLSKVNEFYSNEPPQYGTAQYKCDYPKAEKYQPLCWVCGCEGPKRCAKCQEAAYCCKEHQAADWKAGHNRTCTKPDHESKVTHTNKILFPEYDLVTEAEDDTLDNQPEKTDEEKLSEYKKYMQQLQEKSSLLGGKESGKDLDNMAAGDIDKQFSKFKKRIDLEPDQVLRYERNGQPLWVSGEYQPTTEDIPKCSCGADRNFEFQVMPQLLNHLKVDTVGESLDFGTLAVYTCSKSCQPATGYQPEFVWKQDFSMDSLHKS